jgi:hypothetical protein
MFRLRTFDPMYPIGVTVPKVHEAKVQKLLAPYDVEYIGEKALLLTKDDGTKFSYTKGMKIDEYFFKGVSKTQITNVTTIKGKFTPKAKQLFDEEMKPKKKDD